MFEMEKPVRKPNHYFTLDITRIISRLNKIKKKISGNSCARRQKKLKIDLHLFVFALRANNIFCPNVYYIS